MCDYREGLHTNTKHELRFPALLRVSYTRDCLFVSLIFVEVSCHGVTSSKKGDNYPGLRPIKAHGCKEVDAFFLASDRVH
jgi:hypothetical protein